MIGEMFTGLGVLGLAAMEHRSDTDRTEYDPLGAYLSPGRDPFEARSQAILPEEPLPALLGDGGGQARR